MTLPKRRKRNSGRDGRIRCPAHLAWVRGFECCAKVYWSSCAGPIEAAHVRTGTDGGMGMKPSDNWAISLCRAHHRLQHSIGEANFEREYGIDMKALAQEFAARSPALRKARQT